MNYIKILALLILINISFSTLAKKFHFIDEILKKQIASEAPGCSVAITNKDSSSYFSRGMASLEYQTNLSSQTQMLTASTSKQFLGYAILLLAKESLINLDDKIEKYIPEYKAFHGIKIHQLLNHTSGIRDHWGIFELMGKSLYDEYKTSLVEQTLIGSKTDFSPNERYLYSNGGYFLLTKIVEKVTQQSFSIYMKKAIFQKIGMKNTYYFDDYTKIIKNRADGYLTDENKNFFAMRTHSEIVGPGHIITTIEDFSLWAKFLLHTNLSDLYSPLAKFNGSKLGGDVSYYAGLFKEKFNGLHVYQHAGYYENWRQGFSLYPDKNIAIISLCNRADISTNKLNYSIARNLFSWPKSEITRSSSTSVKTGLFYNKELNEFIYIEKHKEQFYYLSPNNSAYAKLNFNSNKNLYNGVNFQQNNTFKFSEDEVLFSSPVISGSFHKLNFKNKITQELKYIGRYKSIEKLGEIKIFYANNKLVMELENIGTIKYDQSTEGVWVDQDNMSTISFTQQDEYIELNLSLKHMKNVEYRKST